MGVDPASAGFRGKIRCHSDLPPAFHHARSLFRAVIAITKKHFVPSEQDCPPFAAKNQVFRMG
jgi:hypothetical protein